MPHDKFSTKQNCLISDRAFWFGLAVYAVLFIAIASAFAGTVPQKDIGIAWKANSHPAAADLARMHPASP